MPDDDANQRALAFIDEKKAELLAMSKEAPVLARLLRWEEPFARRCRRLWRIV